MDIVDLAARRTPAATGYQRCTCGSAWFALDGAGEHDAAVALNHEGVIVAYTGVPRCLECGRLLTV